MSLALRDGSRIDGSQLISAGRNLVDSLWLFTNGADVFVPINDVVEVRAALSTGRFRTA